MDRGTKEEQAIYISWKKGVNGKNELLEILNNAGVTITTISDTACGAVLTVPNKEDARKFHQEVSKKCNKLINVFDMPYTNAQYKQGVFLQHVPWGIPLEDLQKALTQQGMSSAKVERKKQFVRVEVYEPDHYERLLRDGFNFLNVTRFAAIPDRGTRSSLNWHDNRSTLQNDSNFILQCYNCQGWWHTAANCRYKARCVRCGENHVVEECLRPRSDPVCCHCSGPHSASNKLCPVRLSLVNAMPITITLTNDPETPIDPFRHIL